MPSSSAVKIFSCLMGSFLVPLCAVASPDGFAVPETYKLADRDVEAR